MNCKDVKEHLTEYVLQQEMDENIKLQVEQHLRTCASCSYEADSVRRVMHEYSASSIRKIHHILMAALNQNASHLHIDATVEGGEVKIRKDGRLYRHGEILEPAIAESVIMRLKRMAEVDPVAESSEGSISISAHGANFTVKATFYRTAWGQGAVIGLTEPVEYIGLEDAGFVDEEIKALKKILNGHPGFILLRGPQPVVRKTRLAIASYLADKGSRAVYDIEALTPRPIQNIRSIKAGEDITRTIEHVLRYDPDVVSIAAVPDVLKTVAAIDFAAAGHWVLLETYADDVETFVNKQYDHPLDLLLTGDNAGRIAQSLRVIIRQHTMNPWDGEAPSIYEIDTAPDKVVEVLEASGISEDDIKTMVADRLYIAFEQSAGYRVSAGLIVPAQAESMLFKAQIPLDSDMTSYLAEARDMAASHGQYFLDTNRLASAILADTESQVFQTLVSMGLDPGKLEEILAAINTMQSSGEKDRISADTVYFTPRTTSVMTQAADIAMDEGSAEVTPEHIFRILLSEDSIVQRVLCTIGKVTREDFEKALQGSK